MFHNCRPYAVEKSHNGGAEIEARGMYCRDLVPVTGRDLRGVTDVMRRWLVCMHGSRTFLDPAATTET